MAESTSTIKFPIEQHEQARQPEADTLLAREVYQDIAKLLAQSLNNLRKSKTLDELDDCRNHDAILIDGKRGTGKSSVLVNLEIYLRSDIYKNAAGTDVVDVNKLLILKPVDPTLIENGDDLLLNVVVAALLRNKEVNQKLDKNESQAERFYHQLQNLSNALKGIQTQGSQYGMDRLRAFMGNHGLGQEVHKLFKEALILTDKELIILPIDDVDTSLEHAFTNIEVIRKYLASPYAIPLVSGDMALYGEVIWRNFHGRFQKDSYLEHDNDKAFALETIDRAKRLSQEYQQKVLPLPRRINMPDVLDYLQKTEIKLISNNNKAISRSLPDYHHWLEAILNQQVNGIENSYLRLPVKSVRELAQLINATQQQVIKDFPSAIDDETNSRRLTVMNSKIANIIPKFSKLYNAAAALANEAERRQERDLAYQYLTGKVNNIKGTGIEIHNVEVDNSRLDFWNSALKGYFEHKQDAGVAYFVTQANEHWFKAAPVEESSIFNVSPIFDLPLFNPIQHGNYERFDSIHPLRGGWKEHLGKIISQRWIEELPQATVLPYPKPETGRPMRRVAKANIAIPSEDNTQLEFIRQLMTNRNFYQWGKESNLVCCGRLFELVVLSLVRDITAKDVAELLERPPFFSLAAFAQTKPQTLLEQDTDADLSLDEEEKKEQPIDLESVVSDINQWRANQSVGVPSAWLIYNVMNKFFNQHPLFNPVNKDPGGSLLEMLTIGFRAFNCLLATFGSFEKSNVFGLGSRVVRQNINANPEKFVYTDLFNMNVRPFMELPNELGSVTKSLCHHPLYRMLKESHGDLSKRVGDDLEINKEILTMNLDKLEEDVGWIFYQVFSDFSGHDMTMDEITRLTRQQIKKYNRGELVNIMLSNGIPDIYISNLIGKPDKMPQGSSRSRYGRLLAYLIRYNELFRDDQ